MSGYIDFHIHFIGIREHIEKDPKLKKCLEEVFYLYTSPQPLEILISQMEIAKVKKGVLLSLDCKKTFGCEMPSNETVANVVKEYSDLFVGIGSLNPKEKEVVSKLEDIYSKYEFRGIFLSPQYQQFDPTDNSISTIYEFLQDHKMLLIMHMGLTWNPKVPVSYSRPLLLDRIAGEYNQLPIIITHMGWPWLEELYTIMFRHRNVYAITSGVYTGSPKEHLATVLVEGYRKRITERFLEDRILFGSEFPRMEIWKMVEAVENLDLDEEVKKNILKNNGEKLLKH